MKYRPNHYIYTTTTNTIAIATKDLNYARNGRMDLDIQQVRSEDLPSIEIIVQNGLLADALIALHKHENILPANEVLANPTSADAFAPQHTLVSMGGIPYIRSGKDYISLNDFLKTAHKEELKVLAHQLALQNTILTTYLQTNGVNLTSATNTNLNAG